VQPCGLQKLMKEAWLCQQPNLSIWHTTKTQHKFLVLTSWSGIFIKNKSSLILHSYYSNGEIWDSASIGTGTEWHTAYLD